MRPRVRVAGVARAMVKMADPPSCTDPARDNEPPTVTLCDVDRAVAVTGAELVNPLTVSAPPVDRDDAVTGPDDTPAAVTTPLLVRALTVTALPDDRPAAVTAPLN